MTKHMAERGPVCECPSFQCDTSLGITWDQYDEVKAPHHILVAKDCMTRLNGYKLTKLEDTYSIYKHP